MSFILLGMTGANAFDADAEPQPPDRELREMEEAVGGSKGNAIISADRARQTALLEDDVANPATV